MDDAIDGNYFEFDLDFEVDEHGAVIDRDYAEDNPISVKTNNDKVLGIANLQPDINNESGEEEYAEDEYADVEPADIENQDEYVHDFDDPETAFLDAYLQEAQKSHHDYAKMLQEDHSDASVLEDEPSANEVGDQVSKLSLKTQPSKAVGREIHHRRDSTDIEVSQMTERMNQVPLQDFEADLYEEFLETPDHSRLPRPAEENEYSNVQEEEQNESDLENVNVRPTPVQEFYDPIMMHDQLSNVIASRQVYGGTKVYAQVPQVSEPKLSDKEKRNRSGRPLKKSLVNAENTSNKDINKNNTLQSPRKNSKVSQSPATKPASPGRARRDRQKTESQSSHDGDEVGSLGGASGMESSRQLKQKLRQEASIRQRQEDVIRQLQTDYDKLFTKHALAEVTIDQLRLGAKINLDYQGSGHQRGVGGRLSISDNISSPLVHPHVRARSVVDKPISSDIKASPDMRKTSSLPPSPSVVAANLAKRLKDQARQGVNMKHYETPLLGLKKQNLINRIRNLMKKVDSIDPKTMPIAEQEQLRAELRQAYEELRSEFDRHQKGDEGEDEADEQFDIGELEGELFTLGIKLDELDEQVSENVRTAKRRTPFTQQQPPIQMFSAAPDVDSQVDSDVSAAYSNRGPILNSTVGNELDPSLVMKISDLEEQYLALMGRYNQLKQLPLSPERNNEIDLLVQHLRDICDESEGLSDVISTREELEQQLALDRETRELDDELIATAEEQQRMFNYEDEHDDRFDSGVTPASSQISNYQPVKRLPTIPLQRVGAANSVSENDSGFMGSGEAKRLSNGNYQRNPPKNQDRVHTPLDELSGTSGLSGISGKHRSNSGWTETDVSLGSTVQGSKRKNERLQTLESEIKWLRDQLDSQISVEHEEVDSQSQILSGVSSKGPHAGRFGSRDSVFTSDKQPSRDGSIPPSNRSSQQSLAPSVREREQSRRSSTPRVASPRAEPVTKKHEIGRAKSTPQGTKISNLKDDRRNYAQPRTRSHSNTERGKLRQRSSERPMFVKEYDSEGRIVRRYPIDDDSDEVLSRSISSDEGTFDRRSSTDLVGHHRRREVPPSEQRRSRSSRPVVADRYDEPDVNCRRSRSGSRRGGKERRDYPPINNKVPSSSILRRRDHPDDDEDILGYDSMSDSEGDWPEFEYSEYSFYPKRHPRDASPSSRHRHRKEAPEQKNWRKVPQRKNKGGPVSFESNVCPMCGVFKDQPGHALGGPGCRGARPYQGPPIVPPPTYNSMFSNSASSDSGTSLPVREYASFGHVRRHYLVTERGGRPMKRSESLSAISHGRYESDSELDDSRSFLDLSSAVRAAKSLHKLSAKLHQHLKQDVLRVSNSSLNNLVF